MSHTRPWFAYPAALLIVGSLYLGFVSAQTDDQKKPQPAPAFELPKVLRDHATPTTVEELREIEAHVAKVVAKVMPAVVGVRVGPGQGSAVIVKDDGTLLTAGHVSGMPGQKGTVIRPGSVMHKGKSLGKNGGIDSGMMKILDEGKYPFAEIGKSADLKPGQWVIAIGHPGGFRPNRTPVVRVGRILVTTPFLIRTDCTLVGGDSGGPLFDMHGRVIGIHSRIGGFAITENVHVPIDTFVETWDKLAAGDNWGGQLGSMPVVQAAGGKTILDQKGSLTKDSPTIPSPEDLSKNVPKETAKPAYYKSYDVKLKAGATYTIDLISGDASGKKLDTYLRVENKAGKEVANDDDGGGFPHSRLRYRAEKDGEYRIIATSFSPNQRGAFQLIVKEAVFLTGPVEVLKAIKLPAPGVPKISQEMNKLKMNLHVSGLVVDAKGIPVPRKEINLSWQKGKERSKDTVKTDSDGFFLWPIKLDRTKQLRIDLPKDLRVAVIAASANGSELPFGSGPNDPTIEKVKSAGGKVVKTIDGMIAKTDPFDIERDKCFRHIHEFKMQAGKTYTLDLASEDIDSYLRIEHEEKGKLAEDDDSAGMMNSRLVFTPEADAAFKLVVTTCDPGQLGAYRLTIRETNAKAAPKNDEKKVEKK
jgi:S1-C subfamily serine protease